jgi:hypothetical protein
MYLRMFLIIYALIIVQHCVNVTKRSLFIKLAIGYITFQLQINTANNNLLRANCS